MAIVDRDRKRVRKWLQKWRPRLLLNEWFIDTIYPENPHHEDEPAGGYHCLASNSVNVPYLKMQISIYPGFFKAPHDVQEAALVHELCHAITQPVWNMLESQHNGVAVHGHQSNDAIETLTQRITNIAFWGVGKDD